MRARVTLARGLHYLPCKRSAGDNSPTRVNYYQLSAVMRQFERYYPIFELNYKHLKSKKVFAVYDDIFPPFSEFNVFSIKSFKIILAERVL